MRHRCFFTYQEIREEYYCKCEEIEDDLLEAETDADVEVFNITFKQVNNCLKKFLDNDVLFKLQEDLIKLVSDFDDSFNPETIQDRDLHCFARQSSIQCYQNIHHEYHVKCHALQQTSAEQRLNAKQQKKAEAREVQSVDGAQEDGSPEGDELKPVETPNLFANDDNVTFIDHEKDSTEEEHPVAKCQRQLHN